MKVRSHLPLLDLERLERAEQDAEKSRRLRIIILAINGFTAPAIAMSLGLSRRICQRWLYRYNDSGLEGLADRRGRDRRSRRNKSSRSGNGSKQDRGPRIRSAHSAALTFNAFSLTSSASCDRWLAFIICCIAWAIRICGRDPVTAWRILKPRKILSSRCRRDCWPCATPILASNCACIFKTSRGSDSKARSPGDRRP